MDAEGSERVKEQQSNRLTAVEGNIWMHGRHPTFPIEFFPVFPISPTVLEKSLSCLSPSLIGDYSTVAMIAQTQLEEDASASMLRTDESQQLFVHALGSNLPLQISENETLSKISSPRIQVSRDALIYCLGFTLLLSHYIGVTTQDEERRVKGINISKDKLLRKLPNTELCDMGWC